MFLTVAVITSCNIVYSHNLFFLEREVNLCIRAQLCNISVLSLDRWSVYLRFTNGLQEDSSTIRNLVNLNSVAPKLLSFLLTARAVVVQWFENHNQPERHVPHQLVKGQVFCHIRLFTAGSLITTIEIMLIRKRYIHSGRLDLVVLLLIEQRLVTFLVFIAVAECLSLIFINIYIITCIVFKPELQIQTLA